MCFYRQIARQCRYAIVVIEPGDVYPLLQFIVSLFCEVTVVSGKAHDDFRLLCNATHLVSSGAGAFVMAAALVLQGFEDFSLHGLFKLSISIRA